MTGATGVRHRRPERRLEAGFSVLWGVVSFALLGVGVLCLVTLDPELVLPGGALAGCVGVAAAGLVIAARRDFYEFCVCAGTLSLVAAAACAIAAAGIDQETVWPQLAAGLLGLCGATCLASAWRESHADERLPNVLLEELARSDIYEIDGVQFGLIQSDVEVLAGHELNVHMFVQNGFDSERGFELKLQPRADVGRSGHLALDKELRVDLPGGAAASLWIPIAVHPKARGSYRVQVLPKVTGSGGTRIRRRRAKRYRPPVGPVEQIVALMLGGFTFVGGLSVDFRVRKSAARDAADFLGASPGRAELFYVPEPGVARGIALTL